MRTALAALLLAPSLGLAPEIQPVAEEVRALVGEKEQRSPENLADNATFGVVGTAEGVVLVDPGGSWKGAEEIRDDAFNPAELLLTSLAACMLKGAEPVAPMMSLALRGIEVSLHGVREDSPPGKVRIDYEIMVDNDESDQRRELLHRNIRKPGTISNTLAETVELVSAIRRET